MTFNFDLLQFADILWRTALVLAVGWAVVKVLRKKPAALRYEVAVITMAAALTVPILYAILPQVAVIPAMSAVSDLSPATLALEQSTQAQALAWEAQGQLQSGSMLDDQARNSTPGAISDNAMVEALEYVLVKAKSLSVRESAFLIWLVGLLVMLSNAIIGRARLAGIWNKSRPIADEEWSAVLEEAGDRVFLTRVVSVREVDDIESPMTWGIFVPKLLIPSSLHGWTPERKTNAVMHELVHIRRRDAIHDVVSSLVVAMGWFNPFAWMMRSEVKAAREASCDAEVLSLGAQPEEYAHMLIDVAKGMRNGGRSLNVVMSMARPTQLEGRVLSVLNYAPQKVSPISRYLSMALMACVVLFTSAATMTPAEYDAYDMSPELTQKPRSESTESEVWSPENIAVESVEGAKVFKEESREAIDETAMPLPLPDEEFNPLGDVFAVAGIKLADAVLKEVGQSLDEINWEALFDDVEWDIDMGDLQGVIEDAESFERSLNSTSDSDLNGAMAKLSERLQFAIVHELEITIRENPDSDQSRRAQKALIAIDSDAARGAMKRLGIVPLR